MQEITPHQIDPTEIIQGHVDGQRLSVVREALVTHHRSGRKMRERVIRDNFGNEYLHYSFVASDGEVYDVADWVRPSVILKYGGFGEALLKDFRDKAFFAWDETERELAHIRSTAGSMAQSIIATNLTIGGPN